MPKSLTRGTITPALLIITGAFVIVIYGLLFSLSTQLDFSNRQVAQEEALHVAEAGVNYYRWHLAHDPSDFYDGNGELSIGPYEHEYIDPQGQAIGKFSLEIVPPILGSSVVTIRSTGWTYQFPKIKRAVTVQYGKPSFARYSFLSHASSWYGPGITVNGLIHSNNGIRMDGTNTSLVTSAQQTYICGSETGCTNQASCNAPCSWQSSPGICNCPGVWGGGGDAGLWQYPVPPIYFDSISFEYNNMRDDAEANGLYYAYNPLSGIQGYHIVFVNNGTFRIYQVNSVDYYYGYASEDECQRRYQRIVNETLLGTYNVADIPIIFAEYHLWVEGVVDGRITVIAARLPIDSNSMNIWIPNNLTYVSYDNSNTLGLIAQNDIYFARNIPEDFQVDAALMAQRGRIIRHAYYWWCGGTTHAVKDSLTINGALLTYLKSYWNYGSAPTSGFETRQINYDTNLLYYPPPYFPTSGNYEFISWIEE